MNRLMAKTFILLISLLIIQGCGKEELPPDKLIVDWTVFSTTDEEKKNHHLGGIKRYDGQLNFRIRMF